MRNFVKPCTSPPACKLRDPNFSQAPGGVQLQLVVTLSLMRREDPYTSETAGQGKERQTGDPGWAVPAGAESLEDAGKEEEESRHPGVLCSLQIPFLGLSFSLRDSAA